MRKADEKREKLWRGFMKSAAMGEAIRVSTDVGDFLKEAMVSQKFADVALCCSGGQRFLAHRLVLSAASPYLQVRRCSARNVGLFRGNLWKTVLKSLCIGNIEMHV